MTYAEWMRAVDAEISKVCGGLTSGDLADFRSRDMFDDGCDPVDAAWECIEGDDLASACVADLARFN